MEDSSVVSEAVAEVAPAVVSKISSVGIKRCAGKFTPGISCRVFSFCSSFWKEYKKPLIIATVAFVTIVKVRKIIKKRRYREEWNSSGKDVVVLHAFPRSSINPNLSPYALKLETYLRMANIEYKFDDKKPLGFKGKCPWITLNGKDYCDSELIIEFLGKEFQKDFSTSLSDEQKAVSRAMQIMTDEHFVFGLVWWRFVKDRGQELMRALKLPIYFHFLGTFIIRHIKKSLWRQGFGRHTEYEKIEIIRKDVEAISKYLGTKKFLHGDSPSEIDCCVFGLLSQFVWGLTDSPFHFMIKYDYPNLMQYCERMKERFWTDWEQILLR